MRRICLLALVAIFTQFCFGQAQFGLKAGVNINHLNVTGSNYFDFRSINPGFIIGSTLDLKASDNFFVQPELNYSYLTVHESFLGVDWKYSYFNVPVLLKYKFTKSPVGVYAGPQLGFLLSATSKAKAEKKDIKSDLTNTDFAGVGGIDYKFDNGLRVDLRYQQSVFNLVKVEYADPTKTRPTVYTFTIGYVFK